jgi:hypothetical protein
MSVSIALLPVALAMRIVMGKNNFENWVKAQQVRVPSSFKTELELSRAVKKAGYDAVKFGGAIKTHIDGEKLFFFWEFVDGKWIAVFSKHHDQAILNRFMSGVESVAGKKIFGELANTTTVASAQFPTNFRDGTMLIDALKEFGARPTKRSDGSIKCKIEHSDLLFTQVGDSPFMVEIKNSPSLEQVYRYMSDIDDDYKRCVQTAVYEKIKARAAEKDMVVDSEEVLPDKTIVMTLRVQ